jgi:hypothetical protein
VIIVWRSYKRKGKEKHMLNNNSVLVKSLRSAVVSRGSTRGLVEAGLHQGKQRRLTGLPEGGGEAVMTVVEGISFPLEREEAVESWAAGVVAGAKASEATGAGLLEDVLALFEGGSMRPSSLKAYKPIKTGTRI